MKSLFENKLALFGMIVVGILVLLAIFAPQIAPYDPNVIDIENLLMSPSKAHIMGTDSLGRDLFSRMVYGSRISLSIGFVAVGIATILGIIIGSIAGYYGGKIDTILSRFIDIMLCFLHFS